MEIDTIGTFAMSRAAFLAMRQRGGGRVVNISATLHYGATWWQVLTTAVRAPKLRAFSISALHCPITQCVSATSGALDGTVWM